jgi:GntR family transcriptional regulator
VLIQVDPSSPVPLYGQLLEQVRLALASGVLRPGDRLPGIRELAEHAAINPMTVVRAYNQLIHEGILVGRRGQGTFVAEDGGRREISLKERRKIARKWVEELLAKTYQLGLEGAELARLIEEVQKEFESLRHDSEPKGK